MIIFNNSHYQQHMQLEQQSYDGYYNLGGDGITNPYGFAME